MDLTNLKKALGDVDQFLFDFENLSQEKKDAYDKGFYEKFRKPNNEFDDYGLRFDIDYLNGVGTNILICPVEYMAEYVDIVTKNIVDKSDDEIINMGLNIETDLTKEDLANFNATTCGNMAYVYLHTKNEQIKEYTKRNLRNLSSWKIEQILQYLENLKN